MSYKVKRCWICRGYFSAWNDDIKDRVVCYNTVCEEAAPDLGGIPIIYATKKTTRKQWLDINKNPL